MKKSRKNGKKNGKKMAKKRLALFLKLIGLSSLAKTKRKNPSRLLQFKNHRIFSGAKIDGFRTRTPALFKKAGFQLAKKESSIFCTLFHHSSYSCVISSLCHFHPAVKTKNWKLKTENWKLRTEKTSRIIIIIIIMNNMNESKIS